MSTDLPEKVLIIGPDTLGKSVLTLPGIQLFRDDNPEIDITVSADLSLAGFWEMVPSINRFQPLEEKVPGIGKIKRQAYSRVYLLRDTFRSAALVWRAGIPRRIGFRGKWRRLLLTEIVHRPEGHLQFEYMNILGVQGEPPAPRVHIPESNFQTLERKVSHFPNFGKYRAVFFQALENERPLGSRPIITLFPGGDEARWPAGHFALLAKNLASSLKTIVLFAGDSVDAAACAAAATSAGTDVLNFAGCATLQEQAALLSISDCVVSNAGDGMQLATAVGTPVVVVNELKNPAKTAPIGKSMMLAVPTDQSEEPEFEVVRQVPSVVPPDRAYAAVTKLLNRR